MRPNLLLPLVGLFACVAVPAWAQDNEARNRVAVIENVRLDYAQVLNVEPVYQTLRATRTEQQCDPVQTPAPAPAPVPAQPEDDSRLNRLMDSVKDIFSRRHDAPAPVAEAPAPAPSSGRNCRTIEVGREFRRPIAYDVDYVYKGTKYRSRLPEDPGNRLRIRVSVAPYVPDAVVVPPR
ncbi:hypothetical protein [Xanthomonas translucens]|uniref:hypothetical protein n=1 Tax=Xanthomonas campestris pv. translucens TaxID=343 RepID=UPI0002A78676|nr:hypothetical protein [Xanthomonas translucens]ELQ07212.1 hypothetical protein A989_11764 [Xanthomonas translucens DAR61454]MBC3971523.1 hypothetical protein [Xanthomonas translucens pv. undulosa]MCT8281460.1 hypothetical protein [Xanthomonas translucens pv. undulosa]MCT8316214.1 hypothetical protein [Xanthomonas translucens pv. undulosa]QSQ40826.1 hypothetical protein ISN33_14505 [Xanthomonas translucens pv. translucens]